MLRAVSLLYLIACCLGITSLAQDCGTNPELNVHYSDNFQEAVIKLSSSSNNTSGTIAGNSFFVDGNHSENHVDNSQLSTEQAREYIQQEIANPKAAILATCGYYTCLISRNPNDIDTARAERFSQVCSAAFGEPANGSVSQVLVASPAYRALAFENRKSIDVTAELQNEDKFGSAKVKFVRSDHVRMLTPAATFSIPPSGSVPVKFRITRPRSHTFDLREDAKFELTANSADFATIRFRLVQRPSELLPPASISCGEVNPVMSVTVFSDNGQDSKSSPATTAQALEAGREVIFERNNNYAEAGDGWADGHSQGSCEILAEPNGQVHTKIAISSTLDARQGNNGGGNPGGRTEIKPEWDSVAYLPGDAGDRWTLTATLNAELSSDLTPQLPGPGATCDFSVNGQTKSLTRSHAGSSASWTIPFGSYNLNFSCPSNFYIDARGNTHKTFKAADSEMLIVEAKKK